MLTSRSCHSLTNGRVTQPKHQTQPGNTPTGELSQSAINPMRWLKLGSLGAFHQSTW
jgi:hypothetical protein